jgi:type II restriction/modification system DNA methylase subunit YeeA
VLKDAKGKTLKGNLHTLDYLFAFLNAYDFSSEGAEEIQEDNKQLINASVLGLIFEKINGYKDGSFFTPGFITMYMCRETIRRAVVQKFNEATGWDCKEYNELYNLIKDKKEANAIINSLKICDPAVGSGHFLVSALNELIAIKSDLQVLMDKDGRTLRDYGVEVVNDELIITDTNGDIFEYNPQSKESQRIQETLFHEKQTIIENCLFGVDINPNSVKICRLRLWIELLKNSYYKADNKELETLPNIDINIKIGNSLISRFELNADLKQALKKSKYSIESYRIAVQTYREAKDKEEKREMERLITAIKSDFRSEINKNDPKLTKLSRLSGELYNLLNQQQLFGESKAETKTRKQKQGKLENEIEVLNVEIEEIKSNKIYENAFEWRFEFPEVLNDEGDFVGFDVVIGNPPYVRQEDFTEIKEYLEKSFLAFSGTADLLVYFIEKGINLLKPNGLFQYIVANKFIRAGFGKPLRKYLMNYQLEQIIDFGDLPVFQEATTYPCIIAINKQAVSKKFKSVQMDELHLADLSVYINSNGNLIDQKELNIEGWNLGNVEIQNLIKKIYSARLPLDKYIGGNVFRGILTGLNEAFVINEDIKEQLIKKDPFNHTLIKPFLIGKDVKRYTKPSNKKYLIFSRRGIDIENYPTIKAYLNTFRTQLTPGSGRKKGNYLWYEIQDTVAYYKEFEKSKIIYPNICKRPEFTFDDNGIYTNQKCFIIPTTDKYLLGILNSSVIFFLFKHMLPKLRGDFYEPSYIYLKDFPIASADPKTKETITTLVDQILDQKQLSSSTSILENQIDQLIYQLYDLTEDEIKIVESSSTI